jgi:hypothetical protein
MNKSFLSLLLKLSRLVPQTLRSRLSSLKSRMAKANIIMSFDAYLGVMVFVSLVGALATFFVSLVVLSFLFF